MKKINQVLLLIVVAVATVLSSCTKEGPQGPPGADGTNGLDGTNGIDGTSGCITCHTNDTDLAMKTTQFKKSLHYTGGAEHVGYANYAGGSCSMCHSHNGFMQAVEDGTNSGGLHPEAAAMSCYTCHEIHTSYTREDYGMHYTDAVNFYLNENDNGVFTGLEVDATSQYSDPEGMSNTCIKCHQPRHRGTTQPDPSLDGTIVISDGAAAHWGPHYGAQGAIFGGVGGYIGTTDPTAPSGTKGHHSCKSCHMSFNSLTGNYGSYVGGHSMNMSGSDGEPVFTACDECHTDRGATIDLPGKMASNKILIDALHADLLGLQIIDADGHLLGGTWTHKQLSAYWNYALVKNDHSYGIHNEQYTQDLINAARTYLGTN
ncbi:collagen-like protein [Carboxylicivirga sp. M1479]|uniref:collagen-like protein n=1 Tax=Carboxylicivirga sp. M1479 TaxID=2594476 RepID=UPI0011780F9A|nr:collagen-like protein [Carboxylicivirga sp. M1479]TRX71910.1 collagen-like protein [Carboxylicivirga sp. M1479]